MPKVIRGLITFSHIANFSILINYVSLWHAIKLNDFYDARISRDKDAIFREAQARGTVICHLLAHTYYYS